MAGQQNNRRGTETRVRTAQLGVRLLDEERALISDAARIEGSEPTAWARAALVREARRVLRRERE